MHIDAVYKNLLKKILKEGQMKTNRTGIVTASISGAMIEYDMANGFPILTTKKIAWNGC